MKAIMDEEIRAAVEYLIKTASKHKATVLGFVIAQEPPLLLNFGNCTDYNSVATYVDLCGMVSEKKMAGLSIHVPLSEEN